MYYVDPYNVDTEEWVAVYMCSFDGARGDNYLGGEPILKVTTWLFRGT